MKDGLIQVAGKSYEKSEVVMLPTEKASELFIDKTGKLQIPLIPSAKEKYEKFGAKFQHLYFLSDEESKEGSYIVHNSNCVGKVISIRNDKKIFIIEFSKEQGGRVECQSYNCKKIIASTDESFHFICNHCGEQKKNHEGLCSKCHRFGTSKVGLPRPSNEFLQAYCKANGKIDEVLIECFEDIINYDSQKDAERYGCKLKVSPDNTITIKPFKESWNRQEVISLISNPREKFVTEMNSLVINLDNIDKDTPWQTTEPEWWLEMKEIRKKAFNAIQKFKK